MADNPQPAPPDTITLTLSKSGRTHRLTLPSTARLADLVAAAAAAVHATAAAPATLYDWPKAKFIAAGRLLRAGADDATPIAHLAAGSKAPIALQVPTLDDIAAIRRSSDAARAREARTAAQRQAAVPARHTVRGGREGGRSGGFLRIEPLPGLPNPERSRAFLVRLAEDVGIRAAMRKHGFTVGLLTEMEPLTNTQATHEGTTRLLGLNRNAGEVIELRLRTDAGDGYRAYNTIRKTLCHELAHNVHAPHDASFWALCRQLEREVAAAARAHTLGGGDAPLGAAVSAGEDEGDAEDVAPDHGGWTGGTYVLGGGGGSGRREAIARAVEERMRRAARDGGGSGSGSGGGSANAPPEEEQDGGGGGGEGGGR